MMRWTACLALFGVLLAPAGGMPSPSWAWGTPANMATPATARPTPVEESPESIAVRVGFNGHYKVGVWTPVEITLPASGAREVRLTVPDGDGVPSRVRAPFPEHSPSVTLYARFGRVKSELGVSVHTADAVIADKVFRTGAAVHGAHHAQIPPAIPATRKMIVSVAAEPLGVQDAVRSLRQQESERIVTVRLEDGHQLPDRWYGYEGVDTLVLSTSRLEIFKDLTPKSPQIVALDEWIGMGGKLVICVGSRGQEILSEGSPWTRFAPGPLREMTVLRQTRALETYASSSTTVPQPADGSTLALRVPRLAGVQGEILAREANLPLVIRTPRGFGQIVFLAADLDGPPLSRWTDRPALVSRLLDLPAVRAEESPEPSRVMRYGYHNMAGQLRSALDQFTEVRPVPFWAVAVLIVGYILLIGPADYFLLRKATRRVAWAWVTFPTIVLAVCLAAYGLAYYLKGNQVRINQIDLVDVDTASGRVRGTSWVNLFSPRMEPFTLSLQPNLPGRPRAPDGNVDPNAAVLFSWLGLPGEALGGMHPRAANPVLWNEQYDFSPKLDVMEGVPIQVSSTKSFTARWSTKAPPCLEADLVDDGLSLSGEITNLLGVPLSHGILAYDRYAYELDTIEPGAAQPARIGTRTKRSELKTLLTERRFMTDEAKQSYYEESTPYDRSSVDLPYILRAMMFYRAAGGRPYTGLSNGYQGFVDLSGLLNTNRAILVAQAPPDHRGAELLRDGHPMTEQEDKHLTIYRFVFPVRKASDTE